MKKRHDKPLFGLNKNFTLPPMSADELELCQSVVNSRIYQALRESPKELKLDEDEARSDLFILCVKALSSFNSEIAFGHNAELSEAEEFQKRMWIGYWAVKTFVNAAYAEWHYQMSIQGDLEDTCLEDKRKDEAGNEFVPHKVTPAANFKQGTIREIYKAIEGWDEVEFALSLSTPTQRYICKKIMLGFTLPEISYRLGIKERQAKYELAKLRNKITSALMK